MDSGGKVWHVSKNAKPSSSCRSAKFLGNQKTSFPTQFQKKSCSFKIRPSEREVDVGNANLCAVIRKLNKKDAITKRKALEELINNINHSNVDEVVKLLPLWCKIYENLASDPTHNVRDLTQVVHKMLALKCKRNMAPYLKQLVPVWLFSHFDSYASAASTARSSFYDIFDVKSNRIKEVCLHCQLQILEHIHDHLSKHVAKTNYKDLEDTHVLGNIYSSLELFSLFTEHTKAANLSPQSYLILRSILELRHFWCFGTQGLKHIRTAWFMVINNLVENESISDIILDYKWKIIEISFSGIDENETLLLSAVWKLILQIQLRYNDWYTHLELENIQLKLRGLFQNKFFNNFQVICPKLLPFYSALTTAYFSERDWHTPLKRYLKDLKLVVCSESLNAKENDYKSLLASYFDSWTYILNKFHRDDPKKKIRNTRCLLELLQTNIIEPIDWFLTAKKPEASKIYFDATTRMILEWENQDMVIGHSEMFYKDLLKKFWGSIFDLFKKHMNDTEHVTDEIIVLTQYLVQRNPKSENGNSGFKQSGDIVDNANEQNLKRIVLNYSRCCLNKIDYSECQNCLKHINTFMDIFAEPGFYKDITGSSDLKEAIEIFVNLTFTIDKEFHLDATEIIFKLLYFVHIDEKCEIIKNNLFSVKSLEMQILILERLLFNSLITGEQRELLLVSPEAKTFIRNITKQSLMKGSVITKTWFLRLFLQDENGDFIIGAPTVDALLNDLCEPLLKEECDELKELCGKVLSQVLPIIFTQKKDFHETKAKMFSNIFQVLMESITKNFLTEGTYIKLELCWRNALSNENIVTENTTLHCTNLLKHTLMIKTLTLPIVSKCADLITQFIIGAAKSSYANKVGSMELNKIVTSFLSSIDISPLLEQLHEYCSVLEAFSGMISTNKQLNYQFLDQHELVIILQRSLLNSYIIKQLTDSEDLDVLKSSLSNNELDIFFSNTCVELITCMAVLSAGKTLLKTKAAQNVSNTAWVEELQELIKCVICKDCVLTEVLEKKLLQNATVSYDLHCRSLPLLVHLPRYEKYEDNANIIFAEEMLTYFLDEDALKTAVYFLQYELPRLNHRTITAQKMLLCAKSTSVWIKSASLRYLVNHYFKSYEITSSDRIIETQLLNMVRGISQELNTGNRMLYDVCIEECQFDEVVELLEYIRLLTSMLRNMPWCISFKECDDITKGVCLWVSTMLQSVDMFTKPTVALFIINVCRIFTAFIEFIKGEKKRSSTSLISKTIDDWESLFEKETYWKIFETVSALLQIQEKAAVEYVSLLFSELRHPIMHLDFDIVYSLLKTSSSITPKSVFIILMKNFSNSSITVQKTCFYILHELTPLYVVDDINNLKAINNASQVNENIKHHVKLFEDFLVAYETLIERYLSQFSFKIPEIDEFEITDNQKVLGYLLMWDCIIDACIKSPLFLRSIYTSWLYEQRSFEKFLHFLIRVMPIEVLKNHDTKFITCELFKCLSMTNINDENLTSERFACHLYTKVLKKLPAEVRKWWNVSPSRQKAFVDKLTTNFVSSLISDEELKSIAVNKEHHENMQVAVHLSTREVLAVYMIDEGRTELTLKLPSNYPLGPVRVDCGKHIGGRLSSRNTGKQLALFLTHQNGTILDGLALWKSCLDKKFEGIEECYVCYTVIHHDTCQLPKLTCKTCKKKFHGPCLYKWFTTSSKSTCPICRNVF